MKFKKLELAVSIGLVLCIIFNVVSFGASCSKIRGDVLRLHIIANSDSKTDQALKLKVRDAILLSGYDIFDGNDTLDEAKIKIAENLDKIKSIAVKTLRKEGCKDDVFVHFERTYFNTRYYKNFTLPAGEYEALRVIIGKGEGHNWWCVMFPPLCLAASDDIDSLKCLTKDEKKLITSRPKYEVRFKCVEIYEKIKEYMEKSKS